MDKDRDDVASHDATGVRAQLHVRAREMVDGLCDFEFREMFTPRVVPSLYLLGIVLAALVTLYSVMHGFRESLALGLAWLFVFGPALFLALVVAVRIGLEFLVSIFHLALHVEQVTRAAERIEGQTGEIHSELPRIRFWRHLPPFATRSRDGGERGD